MIDALQKIRQETLDRLKEVRDEKELDALNVSVLGRNGALTEILRTMGKLDKEQRAKLGQASNAGKKELEEAIGVRREKIAELMLERRFEKEALDVTEPGKRRLPAGHLHPMTRTYREIRDALIGMGFTTFGGPEVEYDDYNFTKLNLPLDHPARDMQDTFYITDNVVLRTHTSPMQARTMLAKKPPLRLVVPGKVCRSDDDSTHSPMFNQIEGLVVDKKVSLCDLKGALEEFAKAIFSPEIKVRFRPSYFPFTEPSVEVDVSCAICGGKGCKVCKHTGWIEILGAGIVNPQVLINCGLDPQKYSGYAFGLGIERVTMIKYGIPDIRLLFENDSRFLNLYK